MAVTRTNICREGMESLSRSGAAIYYASVFLYFWVFSTPVVSLVFGSYLYISINWLHIHFDEAFSSLRIANYKSFTRFHIKPDGDLEVFTLGVDKVRKELLRLKWQKKKFVIMELTRGVYVMNESRCQRNGSWTRTGTQSRDRLWKWVITEGFQANGVQQHCSRILSTP